jgi:hypothetical protein
MMDIELIAQRIYAAVEARISKAIEPLLMRLAAAEEKASQPAEVSVAELVAAFRQDPAVITLAVSQYLKEFPPAPGKDGADGVDGKDAEPAQVCTDDIIQALRAEPSILRAACAEVFKEFPPAPGKDGRDGLDGKDGADGKDAEPAEISVEDLVAAFKSAPEVVRDGLREILKEFPPAPGKDGKDGADGVDGKDGADGVGLAGALIDRSGQLVITTTKGDRIDLGVVVGQDGRDGLGFDDLDLEYDGERTVTLKFAAGDRQKSWPIEFPVPLWKGYWRDGLLVKAGCAVSHGGHFWIAKRDTRAKPSYDARDDWALAVQKGRDGKDGRDGIDKTAPVALEVK